MNKLLMVFTKNNIDILNTISSQDNLYIREIAEKTSVSPASVHDAVKLFKSIGFVNEKTVKNRKLVSLIKHDIILRKIKSLINIYELTSNPAFSELSEHGIVGVYGSFSSGDDLPESDIDMWLYPKKELSMVSLKPIVRKIEKCLGREIRLMLLTKEKLGNLSRSDPEFYLRLKLTSVYSGDVFD
ncbi:MAG: winged helix-turn-helix transcriptional regulator [Candidatus Aenigmarchaeota archaeon]|nr:winged helix-turn-helix transcriptional regulator [Candidatus Aenigmarchaeota archaeon]